jgi:hypothetical protein
MKKYERSLKMNKRQRKKFLKKKSERTGIDLFHCQECGAKQDARNKYFEQYGTCDSTCYMYLVGMSWSDFM